jgi:hypothetical protein
MNAQELFINVTEETSVLPTQVYKKANIYYCEKCRLVYKDKKLADECCVGKTCQCGKICKKYYTLCKDCLKIAENHREKERFNKAEKIDIKDYKGYVLDDEHAHDDWGMYFDNYFENHNFACPKCGEETESKDCPDIKEYSHLQCKDSNCGWKSQCFETIDEIYYLFAPEYIWATDFRPVSIDLGMVLENATDDHHESVHDHMKGIKDLEIAIDKFNDINKDVGSYDESHELALINIPSFVQKLYSK